MPSDALLAKRAARQNAKAAQIQQRAAKKRKIYLRYKEIRKSLPTISAVSHALINQYEVQARQDGKLVTWFSGLGYATTAHLTEPDAALGTLILLDRRIHGLKEIVEYVSNDRQRIILDPLMAVENVSLGQVHRRLRH
jgi:hypothetical protein